MVTNRQALRGAGNVEAWRSGVYAYGLPGLVRKGELMPTRAIYCETNCWTLDDVRNARRRRRQAVKGLMSGKPDKVYDAAVPACVAAQRWVEGAAQ